MKLYRTPWVYDCTNFYFEIEQADEFRKYGKSKEHRPNPLVQMGLFMDGDGIPIAFDLFDGASNEQPSLKPLEKKLIRDFGFEQLIVCTDAGLGSEANRRFNDVNGRAFVVTQSLKKLKDEERIHNGSSVYGQLMIITYSPAYALYQRNVRQAQIERAEKKIYDLDDAAIEKEARRWLYIKSDHSNTKGLQSAKN